VRVESVLHAGDAQATAAEALRRITNH
jgi:hypothetical protein